jgi:beta-lactamase regulating signal transducer with metallopeptidase domain
MSNHFTSIAWFADAMIHATVLIGVALIANFLMRRVSSTWRHALLYFSVVGLPLLLALSLVLPAHKLPRSEFLSDSFGTVASHSLEVGAPVKPSEIDDDNFLSNTLSVDQTAKHFSSKSATDLEDHWTLSSWFLHFLAVGVGVIWLRIGIGILLLSCFKADASDVSPSVADIVAKEAAAMGLEKPPVLVFLKQDQMPMTWRLGGHFLALPKFAENWPEKKLRNIIRHELAHIRRNDCYSSWLADVCLALFWFHPLAWLLRRALGHAREAACDDLTLGENPDDRTCRQYARDLLDVIASHSRGARSPSLGLALAMAKRHVGIRKRLEAILDPARDRRSASRSARFFASSLGIIALSSLASLAACRKTDISNPPRTTGSHIQIKLQTVEFEDSVLLEKLFGADASNREYTGFLSPEMLNELLKDLSENGITPRNQPGMISTPGKNATAGSFREFIYPTEYEPPGLSTTNEADGSASIPVTPATPTNFEMRQIGLTYEVNASGAGAEGIGIRMVIEHSRFLGFVNYGSPIMATAKDDLGKDTSVLITENRIVMPIFQSQRYNMEHVVPFGHTVALIGFAPSADSHMGKFIQSESNQLTGEVGPMKHTLYLIQPEFVDGPEAKGGDQ